MTSNERALAASQAEVEARKLSTADLSFHALQWLQYGYLQQGRYGSARALVDTARDAVRKADLSKPEHVDARYTVGTLLFSLAANSNDWSGPVCSGPAEPPAPLSTSARERSFHATAAYQAAVAAVMCGRGDVSIETLRARMAALPAQDGRVTSLKTALLHVRMLNVIRGGSPAEIDALVQEASATGAAPRRPAVDAADARIARRHARESGPVP